MDPAASVLKDWSRVNMSVKTATAPSAFRAGDHIVYPAHGVGRVTGIEKQKVAGLDLEVFVIQFEQDKMTLRVPTAKAKSCGMRALATAQVVGEAMKTLTGRARIKRTMWSRRAQEYEAKINSGDLVSIAEVVRDLHRGGDQPEQSYSERQLYESALDRMARELAAVEKINREQAIAKLTHSLQSKKQAA
jgi:CarD family transcriptional regulator